MQHTTGAFCMPTDDNIEKIKGHKICINCVEENFLKSQISQKTSSGICSYCGENAKYYSLEELSEHIETAFDQYYYRTSDQPSSMQYSMLADKDSSCRKGRCAFFLYKASSHISL